MAEQPKSARAEAQAEFAEKFNELLKLADLSQSALERELKTRRTPVSTKTLNNIANVEHPTQIDKLSAVADFFGLPLWVMFLPGMPKAMLPKPFSTRLVQMMTDYLACSDEDRLEIEKLASVYAGKARRSKPTP